MDDSKTETIRCQLRPAAMQKLREKAKRLDLTLPQLFKLIVTLWMDENCE